ncbi:putative lipid-transfer protein DIR1 [Punica granatum]|uniref:Lipid-transfer protein DIR1 n=1 Tax=Punica granatum TaxID=22663 RepID=A0A218XTU3_PUNGR|nr:putative lipid-transfer protein DIR1 [Punica granatum]OWM87971.1 hypothetical protein CDL15_Pgr000388 [Punica granatum]
MDTRANIVIVSVLVMLAAVANSEITICNVPLSGLQACLPAAKPPSPPPPTSECCASMKDADFCCLYSYRDSPLLPSLGVDPKLAIQIPDKCHLAHPPPSSC